MSDVSDTAGRNLARALAAVLMVLVAIVALPAGVALAAAPTVTITEPANESFTNSQNPLLGGTTDEPTAGFVTVSIHEGSSASGALVQTLLAEPFVEGAWEVTPESLAPGEYTAVAEQTNSEPETGTSNEVTFIVDTVAPIVSLEPVTSPSKTATPTFTGSGGQLRGDDKSVVVTVYRGSGVGGTVAASATVPLSGSTWSYTPATKLAPDGTYTVQATQKDAAGNLGKSAPATFIVDTTAPIVSLNPVTSPTNNPTPTLSGSAGVAAGDDSSVELSVYAGSVPSGTKVQSAVVPVVGSGWSDKLATLADGTYTAQVAQEDAAGNVGTSAAVTFTVITTGPPVTIGPVTSPNKSATPTFTGTGGTLSRDDSTVTVTVYRGSGVGGTVAASAAVPLSGSNWSYTASPALSPDGTYTVQAVQEDSLGNVGKSSAVTFIVDTKAPLVKINAVPAQIKEATPTFGGAAGTQPEDHTNVNVAIYPGTNAKGTPTQSASVPVTGATWSYTATTLADGTYTVQATQEDAAGNVGKTAAMTFTVDTKAPLVTINPVTPSPSKDSTPTLTGAAGVLATDDTTVGVTIYAGSTVTGTVVQTKQVSVTSGSWSYTAAELADGTYTAQATQEDEAGNLGKSAAVTFVIDTKAPIVSINPVAPRTNHAALTLTGSAGALEGDDTSVELTIYQGTTTTGTVQEAKAVSRTGTTWSYTTPKLEDGTYTAQVTQEDKAGNVGSSAAVTFTIDTVAPIVSITPVTTPSKNQTPTLSGAAGTAVGDDATVSVAITQGATVVQSASVAVSGGEWKYAATKLADGTYTAQATQEDGAGNIGKSATITFTIDTTPPVVSVNPVTSPTNDSTPTLTGSGGVLSGDDTSVKVTIYKGATVGGEVAQSASVTLSGSTWTYTPPALLEGVYTVQASQEDKAGNLGVSAPDTFTVDLTAPVVSVHAVASPTNDSTPTLSGAAGTASGDDATVSVKIMQGPTVVQTASVAVSAGEWTYTATKLADGTYTVQATQEDKAGNIGSSAAVPFTIDTIPPVVSIHAVTSPTNNPTPTFTGSGGVLSGDDASVKVTIYKGATVGGTVADSASVTLSGSTWSYTPPALLEGVYTVRATQEDKAGNVGVSAAETFTVDLTAPVVSVHAVASPTNDSTPTLSGAAGTASGDDATVSVKIMQGPTVVQTASVAVSAGEWTYTATKLADGTYTVQASQEDKAGNIGTSTGVVSFTIDTVAPLVTLDPVTTPTKNPTPKLSGLAGTALGDHPTVVVKIFQGIGLTGTVVEAVSVSTSGSEWSYTPATKLADGVYTAQATQGDTAGNVGTSAASTFVVDTTAPLISIRAVPSPWHNATPVLSGTAGVISAGAGTSGDDPSVSVKIYKGAVALGTPVQSASVPVSTGEWTYTATKLEDGTYTAQASQSDEAGNEGTATATFTVDTTPPVVSITSPANNVKLSVGNPPFSGAAGHLTGDLAAITLNIYEGTGVSGKLLQTVHLFSDGETWSLGALPEELENGTYTAQAEQSDTAGNVGKSKAVSFKIATVLTLDPSVFVLREAPATNVTSATPNFHGTAASGKEAGATVTVTINSLASGSPVEVESKVVARTHTRWSTGAMPALPDGVYTVQVEQEGEGGVEETFTVDADAPAVTLSTPPSGSSSEGSSQTVGGSAGTAPGDAAQVTARLYAGASATGAALQTVTVPSSGGTWSTTFGGLGAGTYTAEAEQRDDVGNVGTSLPVTFTVTAPPPAPAPAATPPAAVAPIASFEWVPASPHTGESVTLVSTSTDADSPLTAFAWSLSANAIFQPGPPVLVTSFATAGVHSVELRVTDANGLSNVVTKKIAVTSPVAKLMQPFPVVRIAGTEHTLSVKVSLLTVLAPVGATVTVTCRGHGCPSKSENVIASSGASKSKSGTVLVTLRRFERSLPAGVTLEIKVWSPGEIGKFTRFTVRRGKLPSRLDSCLNPAGTTPIVCPS